MMYSAHGTQLSGSHGVGVGSSVSMVTLDRLIAEQEAALVARMARSRELLEKARASLAGGVASNWQAAKPLPIWIDRGKGSRIWDADGHEYVDMHGCFGAMMVGHAHPAIVRAVSERITKGSHFAQPTYDLIPVTRTLAQRFGLPLWRLTNSGTEATLNAVHLMRQFTGRPRIIKVEGAYHGHHDAVQVSVYPSRGEMGPASRPHSVATGAFLTEEIAALTVVVPFGDLDALSWALEAHPGGIAGMIVEPIMMGIGIVEPPTGYLQGAQDLLRRHGALMTFDEVKTGFTVGPGGASATMGLSPDLICLAKSLGGGLPCGAIGGTPEVMALIEGGAYEQVGTFNGNPLTLAAVRATLEEVLTPAAYQHIERLRRILVDGCLEVLRRYAIVGHVISCGAKGCVVFSPTALRNYRDFVDYDDRWGQAHWLFQQQGGVFLPPWGKCEQWMVGAQHTVEDVARFVHNLETFARALRVPKTAFASAGPAVGKGAGFSPQNRP
jgi:glutamate-1-semialdehyde 2,1-aminomutase